jgi:hypothetical protein
LKPLKPAIQTFETLLKPFEQNYVRGLGLPLAIDRYLSDGRSLNSASVELLRGLYEHNKPALRADVSALPRLLSALEETAAVFSAKPTSPNSAKVTKADGDRQIPAGPLHQTWALQTHVAPRPKKRSGCFLFVCVVVCVYVCVCVYYNTVYLLDS